MIVDVRVRTHHRGAAVIFRSHSFNIIFEAIFTTMDDRVVGDVRSKIDQAVDNYKFRRNQYPSLELSVDQVVLRISPRTRVTHRTRYIYGYIRDWTSDEDDIEYLSAPLHGGLKYCLIDLVIGVHDEAFVDSRVFSLIQAPALRVRIGNDPKEWKWIDGVKNPFIKRVYLTPSKWSENPRKLGALSTLLTQLPSLEEVVFEKGSRVVERDIVDLPLVDYMVVNDNDQRVRIVTRKRKFIE